jgi:glutaredoxin
VITAYIADGCPHCRALLADLDRRRVLHTVVDLSATPERWAEVVRLTWGRRLPIVVDHERVSVGFAGGSSALAELGLDTLP